MPTEKQKIFLRGIRCLSLSMAVLLSSLLIFGSPNSAPAEDSSVKPSTSADQLARQVIENELNSQTEDKSLSKYRETRERDGKIEVYEVIETRLGEIHRLIRINGQPLTPKQSRAEEQRIDGLLANPDEFQEKQKNRNEDAAKERKLFQMLPSAFRYEYGGSEGKLLRLKLSPNLDFHPSGHEAEVFHHMAGTMWVDPREKRMAGLDGQLTSEVKFGGGLFGHLDRGGTFSVRQQEVGFRHWEITSLNVNMNGKVLFFKTIAVHEKQSETDFEPVPESITLEKAAQMLKKDTASYLGYPLPKLAFGPSPNRLVYPSE